MKNNNLVLPIVLLVVGLGVGFGGGYYFKGYQQTQARTAFAGGGNMIGANGAQRFTGTRGAGTGARGAAGGAVTGTVLSMDAKSLTVKMPDGSTKIVLFAGSTTYSNTTSATQSDIKTGSTVAVFGTPNSDGSVTATNIQINPAFGRMMGSPTPAAK